VTNDALQTAKQKYLDSARSWPERASADAGQYVASLSTNDLTEHLAKLLMLIADAMSQGPHFYLKFIGD